MKTSGWRIAAVVALMEASVACSSDPPGIVPNEGELVGEVVKVGSRDLAALPQWRFSPSPAMSIGVAEGEEPYMFTRVFTAARLPSGETLVADGRSYELRVFDRGGKFLRRFGGRGEGPGEFRDWRQVSPISGYRVAALDGALERITVYDLKTGLVSTARYPELPCSIDASGLTTQCMFVGVLPDGTPISIAATREEATDTIENALVVRPPSLAVYYLHEGDTPKGIEQLPTVAYVRKVGRGTYFSHQALFSPQGILGIGLGGMLFGNSDKFVIRERDTRGLPIRTIWVDAKPIAVTRDMIKFHQAWADTAGKARDPVPDYLGGLSPEGHVPFFGDLLLDGTGRIWVQSFRTSTLYGPRVVRHWTVFSADGRPTARINESFTGPLLDIGEDYVLTIATDEEGVESVVEYRIEMNR